MPLLSLSFFLCIVCALYGCIHKTHCKLLNSPQCRNKWRKVVIQNTDLWSTTNIFPVHQIPFTTSDRTTRQNRRY
uniref:Putative secreted protein n=1 Tax=Anopheles marajoara TaxID=58244 RepID=A0A2M4CDG8_9DIPT